MSVDYYACVVCGDTFPDCGEYGTCAKCEENLCQSCYEEQLGKYGSVEEDSDDADYYGEDALCECDDCTDSVIRDDDIVLFLLEKCSITREEVVELVQKERGIEV